MRVRVRKEMQITVAGNVVVATTLTVAGVGWLTGWWEMRFGWCIILQYYSTTVCWLAVTVWGINWSGLRVKRIHINLLNECGSRSAKVVGHLNRHCFICGYDVCRRLITNSMYKVHLWWWVVYHDSRQSVLKWGVVCGNGCLSSRMASGTCRGV